MRSFSNNPYYEPKKCGLRIVASVEKEPDYDFDITVLFKNVKTGALWLCSDTGCSCPVPFEDVRSFDDMTRLQSEAGIDRFIKEGWHSYPPADVLDFKRKGRAAVRDWKAKVKEKKGV